MMFLDSCLYPAQNSLYFRAKIKYSNIIHQLPD